MRMAERSSRGILWVTVIVVFVSMGGALWRTLFPLYLDALGFSGVYVGLIASGAVMIPFLFSLPAGMISDRYGRKKVLVMSLVSMSPLLSALAFARGPTLFLVVVLLGVVASLYNQSMIAMVAEITSASRRATAYGVYYATLNLASTAGALLSGVLAENYGYEILFFSSAVMAAVAAFVALMTLQPLGSSGQNFTAYRLQVRELREVLKRSSKLRNLILAITAHDLFVFIAVPFVVLFAKKFIGMEESEIGIIIGLRSVLTALSQPFMGRLADRFGGEFLLIGHVLLTGMLYVLYGMSDDFQEAVVIMLLFGLVFSMDMPARRALLSRVAPEYMLATVNGISDTLVGVGALVSPMVGGLLWERGWVRATFFLGGLLNMSAVIFLLPLVSARKERMQNS